MGEDFMKSADSAKQAFYSSATINVTPEILMSKGEELKKHTYRLKQQFTALNALMKKTERYWLGEAGNFYRDSYNSAIDGEESIMKRMEEHANDLIQIANQYITTEKRVVQISNSLPGDIIQ